MKAGTNVDVSNDAESICIKGWIFIAESQGYNICRNIYSGIYANFRYIKLDYSEDKFTAWKYKGTLTGRL